MCVIDGYGRPSFGAIREAIQRVGGSSVAAAIYWCGSKDCFSRDQISRFVSSASLPDIEVAFDDVLVTISGAKKSDFEQPDAH